MKKILLIALLLYAFIISNHAIAEDGTMSIERPGKAVSFWGANRNSAASSDPNGILLGSGYAQSDPCYCFILPPILPNHTISSMTIEIKGTGTITSLYIGDFQIAQTGTDDWSCTWDGQILFAHLEDVSDYFGPIFAGDRFPVVTDTVNGKLLWVKLFVDGGSWPWGGDQYDLKKIVVTYTYTNVSNDVLRDFQTMYQTAHDLHLYKRYIYRKLWDPSTLALTHINDTWRCAITSLCSFDFVSGTLQFWPTIKCIYDSTYGLQNSYDSLTTLMNNLGTNFDAYPFWEGSPPAYNVGSPTPDEISTKIGTAVTNLYVYSQNLLSALDNTCSVGFAQAADGTKSSLNTLKSDLSQAVTTSGGLYDIYLGLSGNGSSHCDYADMIIQSLSPLMVYNYSKTYGPILTRSYLDDINNEIDRQFSGSLSVTILPIAAVDAGAQWSIDGIDWHNSGYIKTNLFESNYTITYKPISGWITPPSQTVKIDSNSTKYVYVSIQASPIGDFTDDNKVDFHDLAIFASQWLQPPGNPSADIAPQPNGDSIINFLDFALMAENWMK